MSDLITDAMVESAAKSFANHEFRINGPEMVPFCSCGWTATERYGVTEYDQHVARLTLEAAAPAIASETLEKYAPLELIQRAAGALVWGSRENLILSNELNTTSGASARRRAGMFRIERGES